MEKFTTNRGNPGIIVDGYKFRKDKQFNNSKLWRCVVKNCSSRCKTDLEELMILGGRMEHNHSEPGNKNIYETFIAKHNQTIRICSVLHILYAFQALSTEQ